MSSVAWWNHKTLSQREKTAPGYCESSAEIRILWTHNFKRLSYSEQMPFKPGVSGNPGGLEKQKLFRRALRECLSVEEAKEIARKVIAMAKAGDLMAVNIVADRLDGKPHQSVEITDDRSTNLAERLEQILAAAQEADAAHSAGRETGTRRVN
jgi:hypothetical protein